MTESSTTAKPPKRRVLSWRRKAIFATVPLVVLLVIGEWFARWRREGQGYAPQGSSSFRDTRIDLMRRAFPCVHDPLLGYRPEPNYSGDKNVWGTQVTINSAGLRSNGADRLSSQSSPAGPAILAVGDSYTFGDQVSDHESWPAQLEQLLRRPVHNGGVFGYSFGQSVLRAEQLLESHKVDILVQSLIPEDLNRCELSHRYTPKPWFALLGDRLELRGVPVVDSAKDNKLDGQWLRKLMGYSALLDTLFWKACPSWWVGQERLVRVHPAGTGLQIGKLLLERLQRACRQKGVRLLLVLQGQRPELLEGGPVRAPELIAHGKSLGIATLDLATRFRGLADADASLDGSYFAGHMTPVGNAWVAEQIADRIRRF